MRAPVSDCPLEQALRLLAGRWRTLIVYELSRGPQRFNALQRALVGLSARMLALDLKALDEAGVIRRTDLGGIPPQVEYALTLQGSALVPVLAALGEWWETLPVADRAD